MLPGLVDVSVDSQRIFRAVLEAMARPGRIADVEAPALVPPPLHRAAAGACLALVDLETPLWIDEMASTPAVVEYLRFHTGMLLAREPGRARFALVADPTGIPPLAAFDAGTDERPDLSTTLLVQVESLVAGRGRRLTGPGIAGEARLDVKGLPSRFWNDLDANRARFPRGVDLILTAGRTLTALPRSIRVEI
jgi:alpha-D-ribose 1-methylphosphonate 5-triphosphate synthase subunit PhnH